MITSNKKKFKYFKVQGRSKAFNGFKTVKSMRKIRC